VTATFWLLKSLHILALALGLGGGVANAIAARLARSRPEAAPAFGALQKRIGMVSVGALVVLWITGPWMAGLVYGAALPLSFWLKMLAVLGLTAMTVLMQVEARRAARAARAPDAARMAGLGAGAGLFSILAVILAVISFN
jgi:hypothetical protein